jgi:hypothetical protein
LCAVANAAACVRTKDKREKTKEEKEEKEKGNFFETSKFLKFKKYNLCDWLEKYFCKKRKYV